VTSNPDSQPTTSPLHSALEFLLAGVNVVPVREDGSKAPSGAWKLAQSQMTDAVEVVKWATTAQGFGIITGAVSGNLEMLELEGRAVAAGLLEEARDLAHDAEIGDIWDKLQETYIEMTPSGGIHWLYRIDGIVPGNTKIAQRPGANDLPECWIETRGEGGFVVVAPSSGTVHPTGQPWVRLDHKTPADIVTFTEDERAELHSLLRLFDTMPVVEEIERTITTRATDGNLSPGDDYNARTTWDELLVPAGWKKIRTMSTGEVQWTRPGKDRGISATTGRTESDNLYVWSTSTQFEQEKPYSKWAVFTLFNFHSLSEQAFKDSTKALRGQGYGSISVVPDYSLPAFQMPDNVDPDTGEVIESENRGYDLMLAAEIQSQRIRKQAKEHLRDEDNLAKFKLPEIFDNLTIELEQPDEEAKYLINELFPTGGNITLTAEYKSGKTTLINNIVKSLVDDHPFLGKYGVNEHDRNVVIFNYEVEPRQYRQWMREVGIINTDRVKLVHLRGLRMPMTSDFVQERVIDILRDFNAQTWIVDPLARAFVGSGDENSNSDVGLFLDTLDVIKYEAGVENLIVAAHTGRASETGIERARGASRFDDWADVRWILTKNDEGQRFLKAHGRDVDMEQHLLTYDADSRSLGIESKTNSKEQSIHNLMDKFVATVKAHPGITSLDLKAKVGGKGVTVNQAYNYCIQNGSIIVRQTGSTKCNYTSEYMAKLLELERNSDPSETVETA
jgi:hypothetical protein